MGNLQEELEIRIESLKMALKEAINLPEVADYIKKSEELLRLKQNKKDFSVSGYNNILDSYMTELDDLKETQNVKLFLWLLDNYNKIKNATELIHVEGQGRK